MKKGHLFLLSLLSGLLFVCSWYPYGFPFLIFFAFIPILFISDFLLQKKSKLAFGQMVLYALPALLIWNAGTTWWIWNSTPEGAVGAIVLNSLFMSLFLGLWHLCRAQKISEPFSAITLIAFWMSWEYLHLHWDLTWPWLNLGNVFASYPSCVQWYEFTGTFGGTLWILLSNYLLFILIKLINNKKSIKYAVSGVLLLIAVPLTCSLIRYATFQPEQSDFKVEAVIVQPNTDAPDEEYSMNNAEHFQRIMGAAKTKASSSTNLIIAPESALPHNIREQLILDKSYDIQFLSYFPFAIMDSLTARYPNLNLILGTSTSQDFNTKISSTCQEYGEGKYREFYNTAISYHNMQVTGIYHKSRLVPGVEKMPFPKLFGFMEEWIIKLGGSNSSLGVDSIQRAFTLHLNGDSCKIGAPVCYESIYGELFGNFVKDGAQMMCVITNDDWWGNTPGHRQHFMMSRLRAVESRRMVLRAANTGISGVINERGDVVQKTAFKTRTALKQIVTPQNQLTFYVKHGDWLAKIALILAGLSLLYALYRKVVLWKKKR
ncbi:MAG: apolipoprotein N-acyltransferase [Bacteroidales bacterium]|jgi:apolipoprotein N-acyltransferase|nr:apolipoprotein N-acyltransferase [Bacteroidales bacterium]